MRAWAHLGCVPSPFRLLGTAVALEGNRCQEELETHGLQACLPLTPTMEQEVDLTSRLSPREERKYSSVTGVVTGWGGRGPHSDAQRPGEGRGYSGWQLPGALRDSLQSRDLSVPGD